ncbi:hypothetical protein OZ488_001084 [Escherichia coli]|nr:hypothetical protein [Escherichia coli]EFJ0226618.1 hypothetical protein [Escherichia coli]EIV8816239.1 hypothetical protein [Escherichia coli]EKF7107907.1 hypothetical protein [Escherichia coli]EKW2839238.1 hypothetical protein [Escherichia coli]
MLEKNVSPGVHLLKASKSYPTLWREIDLYRQVAAWPEWCFIPVGRVMDILLSLKKSKSLADRLNIATDGARLAGLAAWRVTQGIYRFDSDLYDSLINTPVSGMDLPSEVLKLLPEWGVYVETPYDCPCQGFFAHCEWDHRTKTTELRLLLDVDNELLAIPVPLINSSLELSIESIIPGMAGASVELEPLISLLLYICSITADFGHYSAEKPVSVKTKKGYRLFPPTQSTIIQVGNIIGSTLRESRGAQRKGGGLPTGKVMPAHVRRAHWHGYWSGSPKKFAIRWMPPILVNCEDVSETVHQVK